MTDLKPWRLSLKYFEFRYIDSSPSMKEQEANYIKSLESMATSAKCWSRLAREWGEVANSETEVSRCLQNAMDLSRSFSEWEWCTLDWLDLSEDKEQAAFCLTKSKSVARTSQDWLTLANNSSILGLDKSDIEIALENAEACAYDFYDYTELATSYKTIFNATTKAKSMLKKAELFICDDSKWHFIATLWEELAESSWDVTRCFNQMKKRELIINNPFVLDKHEVLIEETKWKEEITVASLCESAKLCDDYEETQYYPLYHADKLADSTDDWLLIAYKWKIFNNKESVTRCLGRVVALAKSTAEYLEVAEVWLRFLDNRRLAQYCIDTAKKMLGSNADDYFNLARIALFYGLEDTDAKEYLAIAESLAKPRSTRLLCNLAELWAKLPGEDNRVISCLTKAEESLSSRSDCPLRHYKCANLWLTLTNDQAGAKRCLEKAQSKVNFTVYGMREYIGKCIELTGDSSLAKKFLKESEDKISTFDDWLVCCQSWLHINTDTKQAKRCLEEAKNLAPTSEECDNYIRLRRVLLEEPTQLT